MRRFLTRNLVGYLSAFRLVHGQPAGDVQDVPHVPRAGQGRLRRGLRLPGARHRQDVRLQETGEEAHQEAQGRGHGPHREADPPEDQLALRRTSLPNLT